MNKQKTEHVFWKKTSLDLSAFLKRSKPLWKNSFSTNVQGTGPWEGPIHFSRFVPRFTISAHFSRADPGAKRRKQNLLQQQHVFSLSFSLYFFLSVSCSLFLFFFLINYHSLSLPLPLSFSLSLYLPFIFLFIVFFLFIVMLLFLSLSFVYFFLFLFLFRSFGVPSFRHATGESWPNLEGSAKTYSSWSLWNKWLMMVNTGYSLVNLWLIMANSG